MAVGVTRRSAHLFFLDRQIRYQIRYRPSKREPSLYCASREGAGAPNLRSPNLRAPNLRAPNLRAPNLRAPQHLPPLPLAVLRPLRAEPPLLLAEHCGASAGV
tara:strand:+ start:358 stop:666 length:309 start_codon:yes stop_codon:yes gene_type:complete